MRFLLTLVTRSLSYSRRELRVAVDQTSTVGEFLNSGGVKGLSQVRELLKKAHV